MSDKENDGKKPKKPSKVRSLEEWKAMADVVEFLPTAKGSEGRTSDTVVTNRMSNSLTDTQTYFLMYDRYKTSKASIETKNKSASHHVAKAYKELAKEHGLNEVEKEDHSFNFEGNRDTTAAGFHVYGFDIRYCTSTSGQITLCCCLADLMCEMTKSKAIETDTGHVVPNSKYKEPTKRALKQQASSGSREKKQKTEELARRRNKRYPTDDEDDGKKDDKKSGKGKAPESKEVVSFRKVISKHREDDFVKEVLAEVVPFMREVGSAPMSLQCLEKFISSFRIMTGVSTSEARYVLRSADGMEDINGRMFCRHGLNTLYEVFQKAVRAGNRKLDKSLPQEDGLKAEKLSQNFDHFFVARLRKMGDYSLGPYAGVALHSDLLSLVLVRAVTYLLKKGIVAKFDILVLKEFWDSDKYLSQLCKFDTFRTQVWYRHRRIFLGNAKMNCGGCAAVADWQITDWNTRLQQDEAPAFSYKKDNSWEGVYLHKYSLDSAKMENDVLRKLAVHGRKLSSGSQWTAKTRPANLPTEEEWCDDWVFQRLSISHQWPKVGQDAGKKVVNMIRTKAGLPSSNSLCRLVPGKSLMNKDLKFVMEGMHLPVSKKEIMAHAQKGSHGFVVVVPLEETGTWVRVLPVTPLTKEGKLDKCRKIDPIYN
jgi:hypothetical protein